MSRTSVRTESASRRYSQGRPRDTSAVDGRYLQLTTGRHRTVISTHLRSSLVAAAGRLVGISSDGLTDLYIVPRGTVDAQLYRDDILDPIVRPHACTMADCFILQDDNARPHRARLVENYLHEETIVRMG
ncbi:hypothetical protein AVEN_67020-1 [Araneus ventricosus]|uniref:Tc1-like transposase DDE domain-containing protein n=1 Tax=Araneus ventricosus TaxID=182803 RepID=A0A4Y2E420_ARAVE|nr:hypothetical protein AVEN_67020-1 [Araneus ventricosus]